MSFTIEDSVETNPMLRSGQRVSIYLDDHLAGETLGLELATRAGAEHKGSPLGDFLLLLSWELEEDRESLVKLIGELGVRRRHAGVFAEITGKVGHMRPTASAPLPPLVE